MNFEHLTDEQFANILAGDRRTCSARLHVESCADCQQELTSLGAAVGDLNFASLRWAEQRAARIEVPSRWVLNWNAMPGWGATAGGRAYLRRRSSARTCRSINRGGCRAAVAYDLGSLG